MNVAHYLMWSRKEGLFHAALEVFDSPAPHHAEATHRQSRASTAPRCKQELLVRHQHACHKARESVRYTRVEHQHAWHKARESVRYARVEHQHAWHKARESVRYTSVAHFSNL